MIYPDIEYPYLNLPFRYNSQFVTEKVSAAIKGNRKKVLILVVGPLNGEGVG